MKDGYCRVSHTIHYTNTNLNNFPKLLHREIWNELAVSESLVIPHVTVEARTIDQIGRKLLVSHSGYSRCLLQARNILV